MLGTKARESGDAEGGRLERLQGPSGLPCVDAWTTTPTDTHAHGYYDLRSNVHTDTELRSREVSVYEKLSLVLHQRALFFSYTQY